MSKVDVTDEGSVISVKGSTFPIKDQLKAEGARWRGDDKAWIFDSRKKSFEQVQTIVKLLTGGEKTDEDYVDQDQVAKRKADISEAYREKKRLKEDDDVDKPKKLSKKFHKHSEITAEIKEAKDLWQKLLEELGENPNPGPILNGAAVRLYYIDDPEDTIYRPHSIITFKNEFYRTIAEKVCQHLKGKGLDCHVTKGKSDYVEY